MRAQRTPPADLVASYLLELSEEAEFLDLRPLNVNSKREPYGNTPLKIAAVRGDAALVEALLLAGAEVNARNEDDYTALHHAVSQGHSPVVQVLLRYGADATLLDRYGKSSFDYAESSDMRALLIGP